MARPDATWDLERYSRCVKAAVFLAYAENKGGGGGGARLPDVIREFQRQYEFNPDLSRFGFRSLESFLDSRRDLFERAPNGFAPNVENLTANEKTQLNNMVRSYRSSRSKPKRGEFGGSRGRNPNFGHSGPVFGSSNSAFVSGGTSRAFLGRGAFNNSGQNYQAQKVFGEIGNSDGSFQNQNNGFTSKNGNYNQSQNGRSTFGGQNQQTDRGSPLDYENRLDREVEEAFSQVQYTSPPGFTAPAPSPPPGWGPNNVGSTQAAKTLTAPSESKISVGAVAKAVVTALWRRWPEAVEESLLLALLDHDATFSGLKTASSTTKKNYVSQLSKRLRKSIWSSFVYVHENYYIFKAQVPARGDLHEQGNTVAAVVLCFLWERGPKSVSYLANAIGLGEKEGYSKVEVLDIFLRDYQYPRIVELQDFNSLGHHLAKAVAGAQKPNWRPEFPENIPLDGEARQERRTARQQQQIEQESERSNHSGTDHDSQFGGDNNQEVDNQQYHNDRELVDERRENSGDQYYQEDDRRVEVYQCQHSPLSTILLGNREHFNFEEKFKVYVSNIVDLTTFWVRTAEDDREFRNLTEDLSNSLEPQAGYSIPTGFPTIGALVVYAIFSRNEPTYYRAKVLDKNRTRVRLESLDIGGISTVSIYDVYPLPQRFQSVPPLSTRCSIGAFRAKEHCEEQLQRTENEIIESLTYFELADIKIHHTTKDSLIVDLSFEDERISHNLPSSLLNVAKLL